VDFTLASPEGATLTIAPGRGFNAYRWSLPWRGRLLDVLWAEPGFPDAAPANRSGIPILFPFPNRIRNARFEWDGRTVLLAANDATGQHAIHGHVLNRPWTVERKESFPGQARGTLTRHQTEADWPGEYTLSATYRLGATTVELDVSVVNSGRTTFPFGLGVHPYFRVAANTAKIWCLPRHGGFQVEAWQLSECFPSGQRTGLANDHFLASASNQTLGARHLDDAFRVLNMGGWLLMSEDGWGILTTASASFCDTVLFTPPHRQAVCIEPYTCITDAANLAAQRDDTGWRTLRPGEHWQGWIRWEFLDFISPSLLRSRFGVGHQPSRA
jgi:aldose 1-epimerase